jgi:large subunit ribosomal protein L21
MYAIIAASGRQYKVIEGQELQIDYRKDVAPGDSLSFDRVVAYSDGSSLKLGEPTLGGAVVTAKVLGVEAGPKLVVQKFRRRKTYRRKTGHRQLLTRVKIDKISLG